MLLKRHRTDILPVMDINLEKSHKRPKPVWLVSFLARSPLEKLVLGIGLALAFCVLFFGFSSSGGSGHSHFAPHAYGPPPQAVHARTSGVSRRPRPDVRVGTQAADPNSAQRCG